MAQKNPIVSVVLPVYNGARYLSEAITSILGQTFIDYECIIVNDGSIDDSEKIIQSFTDPRIIYIKNEKNIGIAMALNKAVAATRGEYIVRMDADDISLPQRIQRQVDFMSSHPDISIAGSFIECFGSQNTEIKFPTSPAAVQSKMLLSNVISSPTVIIRKKNIVSKHISYLERHRYENEYNFYTDAIMAGLCLANIPEILVKKRIHPDQMSNFFESRVRDVERTLIQKQYFSFLVKKGKIINPNYFYPAFIYMQRRFSKRAAFTWRKIYLKKKEWDFYHVSFKKCFHANCDTKALEDKNVLDLATVAFNNADVIRWQIKLIRKYVTDKNFYTVFDNSTDNKKSDAIRDLCVSENVAYVRLPKNHLTRSASHGSSLNWIYKNYFRKRSAAYFGFLDHDIFPIKQTSVVDILNTQSLYGHLQERSRVWYLWAGFCFFKSVAVGHNLNFLPGKADGIGVDTGGMNWQPIYSKIDRTKILFPKSWYEKIRESRNPSVKVDDMSLDHVEHIGDWMHTFSSSGWKKMRDQKERDEKVKAIIENIS